MYFITEDLMKMGRTLHQKANMLAWSILIPIPVTRYEVPNLISVGITWSLKDTGFGVSTKLES